MNNLLAPEFFVYFLYSTFAILISIFVPGFVVLKAMQLKQSQLFNIVESFVIGTALWVTQGFLLGFLNLRIISYFYLIAFAIFFLATNRLKRPIVRLGKNEILAVLLILTGTIVQSTAAFFMGVRSMQGLSFCCVDISDNLYFASLSQAVSRNMPPFEPGLYGVVVNNYHYLSNVFVGELVRIFHLPVTFLQFQFSNIYLPVMFGLTVLVFGRAITSRWKFSFWLLFFSYFGGDFIWLILLFRDSSNIFAMSSLEDGAKFLSNPPRAYAVIQFMGGLSLLKIVLQKNKNLALIFVTSLVFGTLVGFKVYIGIFGLVGLFVLAVVSIFRKTIYNNLLFVCALAISLMIYIPVNKNAGGLYFTSFWFFENFIVQPGLHFERLELARRIFFNDQKFLKAFLFDGLFILLSIFGLFGTKLIGLIQGKSSLKILPKEMHIFFLSGLSVSFVLGFFFQQNSGGSNTFNFIVNVFIVLSVYCAATITWITSKKAKIGIIISIFVIVLTIPRVLYEFQNNMTKIINWNVTTFPNDEVRGLEFLSKQQKGLVLVDHRYFKLDEISPYMSLYTKQPMFLSGIGILDSHGVKPEKREEQYIAVIERSASDAARMLYDTQVSYIITRPHALDKIQFYTESIYSNSTVQVLRLKKESLNKNSSKNRYYSV